MEVKKTDLLSSTAKPELTATQIAEKFGTELDGAKTAILSFKRGGLTAVAKTLVFLIQVQGYAAQSGYTVNRKAITIAVLGTETPEGGKNDAGVKVFRTALRLNTHWGKAGMPESVRGANSVESGESAVIAYLAGENVTSLERLNTWLTEGTAKGTARKATPAKDRALKAVKAGAAEGEFSVVDGAAMGTEIINSLPFAIAGALAVAVAEAYAARAATVADGGAEMAEKANADITAPAFMFGKAA